jgi:hypothetical protein
MLGSIKGQDAGKAVAMVFIIVGVALVTLATVTGNHAISQMGEWIKNLFALRM